ncbi:hypothetical protein CN918_29505 [Priestia megaterium]|nr:hypothetical protein CN918_29505 [Priestia megaterium]
MEVITVTVRLTQILMDEGWKFVDQNGTIDKAYNKDTNEVIEFQSESEFINWIDTKVKAYNL